jgi:hypothetical protein
VQILVEVANIQVRSLKTEVEKGSACTVIVRGLVGPKAQANAGLKWQQPIDLLIALHGPKGKQVNIPAPRRGEASHLCLVGAVTQANLLTLLEVRARDLCSSLNSRNPGIGSAGDRVCAVVKQRGYCVVPSASKWSVKKQVRPNESLARPYPSPQQVSKVNSL